MQPPSPVLPKPRLSDHPVDVGLRSEAAILAHLVRRGFNVLIPVGVNQRYDLVLDCEGDFLRAQCKTGRLEDGAIVFNTQSIQSNTRSTAYRGYVGEADVFLVYCAALDRVYSIPVDAAPSSHMRLRVQPARNGQAKLIHWASEYELPG